MAKKFSIGSQSIEVSDALERYNELRYEFTDHAQKATDYFNHLYLLENSSLEDVVNNCQAEAEESLSIPITESIRLMIPQEIYDVDMDIFLDDYCTDDDLPVMGVCRKYIKQYKMILAQQELEKQMRRDRRDNRSRLIVGGFGIKGIIKAHALSTFYDAATWVAHSAVNVIGDAISDYRAGSEARKIFNDPHTKADFVRAMWESAFNIHYAYIRLLENRTNTSIEKYDPEQERRALAINNNISLLLPDRETEEKMAAQMLSLSPYDIDFYSNLIQNYGDESGELQEIGEFFHLNMDDLKKSLLREYAKKYTYRTMSSADDMISDLENKATFYGMKKVPKKTSLLEEKVDFNNWQFEQLFDKDTNLYLSDEISKKELMTAMTQLMKEMRLGVQSIYEKNYTEDTPRIIGPNSLPNGFWFALRENTESLSTILFFARDGLHFGRSMHIDYNKINSIEITDDHIIINEAIRLNYDTDGIDTAKLKSFMDELVAFFMNLSTDSLIASLGMTGDNLSIGENNTKVLDILKSVQKDMWRILRNITVFNPSDPSHILALKNIKSRWHILQNKSEAIAPLFWTWAGKDHVVFTDDEICLTATGLRIPYKNITNVSFYENDSRILIDYDDMTHVIVDEPCDDIGSLVSLLNSIVHTLGGLSENATPSGRYTYESDTYMEEFDKTYTDYVLTRVGDDSRNDFSQYLLMEHYDQSFTYIVELFRKKCPDLANKAVLFLLNVGYSAVLVTKDEVYTVFYGHASKNPIPLSDVIGFETDYSSEKKTMNMVVRTDEGTEKSIPVFDLFGNPFVAERTVFATRISNMALHYVQNREGLPVKEEDIDLVTNVNNSYKNYAFSNRLIRRTSYWGQANYTKNNKKWIARAREVFYSAGVGEQIVFFYNSSKRRPGSSGIVLTNHALYLRGKQMDMAPLSDIIEYRGVTKGGTHYIELGMADGEVRHVDFKHIPDFDTISDLLSDLIFMTRHDEEEVIAAFDHDNFVEARKIERRSIPGEMNDEQRDAIQILSDFCTENQLFDEESDHEILFNDGSDEFMEAFQKAVEKSSDKPDPIEIPILLIRKRGEKKLRFGIGSDTVILTNEYWYNLSSVNSLFSFGDKVPARLIKDVNYEDSNGIGKSEVTLIFDKVDDPAYFVLKTKDDNIEGYKSFFIFIREQYDSLAGIEDLSDEEKEALIKQTNAIAEGVESLNLTDSMARQEELLSYPWECSVEAEERVEKRVRELASAELDSMAGSIESASADEVSATRDSLLSSSYPERYLRKYIVRAENRLKELNLAQVKEKQDKVDEIINASGLESPCFGNMNDRTRRQMTESLMALSTAEKAESAVGSLLGKIPGKAAIGGLLNKGRDDESDEAAIEINPWEIPLASGISAAKSGYIFTEDKFITYNHHKLTPISFESIDGFAVQNKGVTQTLAIKSAGKTTSVTGVHGKRSEEYARVLSQILDFLKTGSYKPADSYEIEIIVGNDSINKVSGIASEKLEAVSKIKPPELSGKVPGLSKFGKKKDEPVTDTKAESDFVTCGSCGNKIKVGKKFCGFCGSKLE